MDPILGLVLGLVAGTLAGAAGWGLYSRKRGENSVEVARAEATRILETANKEAELVLEKAEVNAQQRAEERVKKIEKDLGKRRADLDREESRLRKREEQLEKREDQLGRREQSAGDKEKNLDQRLQKAEEDLAKSAELKQELIRKTEEICGLTAEEAKKLLLESLESEVQQEAAALIRRIEAETQDAAEKKARQIVTLAVQRCATDMVTETTVSVINLPSDDMKGRIIGREGRNIRALEQATGVNIIVDDTPEAVVLSCFDPMRREIARQVLDKLIADGRIHPSRIEELVEKTEKQVLNEAREAGEAACIELGIPDLHPELIKLLGRLKFRTSYGQNVLKHSVECAHIAEMLASELGLDAKLAKRATLLHDIGKAVSHEMEGPHAAIGAELAKKYRERPEVVHAIEAHHLEVKPRTLTAVLVQTADAVSAARPGARRETLESYVKRLENLEAIASAFDGVEKAFAIQAGREVRIIVEPEKLNDNECSLLARNVTKRIEEELQYPGQIKVVVVRETRQTEYAR
ncbi:ribonuclease Y [Candidatus Poribacteria bacterium]|nr:ribonuclease Y [Candidatus Poribacteria bacterium]